MKTYILGAVLSLAIIITPALAQAQTASLTGSQINAILQLLQSFGADQSVINNVQASLTGGAPTTGGQSFCHNFNSDLTVGNNGDDVSALNQAIATTGIAISDFPSSTFDENTAAYVVRLQAKYGIRQTGYVGPLTRAKLNSLYGCNSNQQQTAPFVSSITPNSGSLPTAVSINGTWVMYSSPKLESSLSPTVANTVVWIKNSAGESAILPLKNAVSLTQTSPMVTTISSTLCKYEYFGAPCPAQSQMQIVPGTYSIYVQQDIGASGQQATASSNPVSFTVVSTSNPNMGGGLCPTGQVWSGPIGSGSCVSQTQPTNTPLPNISYINPTTTSVGSTVYVYGSNLYGMPMSLDGISGLYGTNYPDTSGNSFSFVVPSNMSVGVHTLGIAQKATGTPGNSVTFTVTTVPNISSIGSEHNTPIHAGDMVIVSGSNLYGAPFTLDGNYGTLVSQQDSSGASFSFVVPWNISAGTHTVQVAQKVTGVLGNSATFTVTALPPAISYISPTISTGKDVDWVDMYGSNFFTQGKGNSPFVDVLQNGVSKLRLSSTDNPTTLFMGVYVTPQDTNGSHVQLRINNAALGSGTYQVRITNDAGTSNTVNWTVP